MKNCEMSYRNMYNRAEYNAFIESQKYVLNEKYFIKKQQYQLPEGFSLEVETYADVKSMGSYSANQAFLQSCILRKAGGSFYKYNCADGHVNPFLEWIEHSNGHRYYPFHIHLYGISYIDIDTAEVYHYIPEGYPHNGDSLLGESFIITDIHYDRNSDLIAYGGCFWAAPSDVMIGDFSEPLRYKPEWMSMREMVDPDYEKYDDLDFDSWGENELMLSGDGIRVYVSMDKLMQ